MEALSSAILPVANAFIVLLLVASLYAAVAVMLFGQQGVYNTATTTDTVSTSQYEYYY